MMAKKMVILMARILSVPGQIPPKSAIGICYLKRSSRKFSLKLSSLPTLNYSEYVVGFIGWLIPTACGASCIVAAGMFPLLSPR